MVCVTNLHLNVSQTLGKNLDISRFQCLTHKQAKHWYLR